MVMLAAHSASLDPSPSLSSLSNHQVESSQHRRELALVTPTAQTGDPGVAGSGGACRSLRRETECRGPSRVSWEHPGREGQVSGHHSRPVGGLCFVMLLVPVEGVRLCGFLGGKV